MNQLAAVFIIISFLSGCGAHSRQAQKNRRAYWPKFHLPKIDMHRKRQLIALIDDEDKKHFYDSFNFTEPYKMYSWYNRKSQISFRLYPEVKQYPVSSSIEAQPCRKYVILVQHGTYEKKYRRKACRKKDRTWDIVQAL